MPIDVIPMSGQAPGPTRSYRPPLANDPTWGRYYNPGPRPATDFYPTPPTREDRQQRRVANAASVEPQLAALRQQMLLEMLFGKKIPVYRGRVGQPEDTGEGLLRDLLRGQFLPPNISFGQMR